jgi:hypothetical protein
MTLAHVAPKPSPSSVSCLKPGWTHWPSKLQGRRPVTPEVEGQLREEVIAREVFMQETPKAGIAADFKAQMELARQT